MKKLSYHVNPVIRKREEEIHLKNMEAKIRAAKSSIPGAKNKSNGQPGSKYQVAGATKQGSRQTTPASQREAGWVPAGNEVIDDMIHARLEDILGQPLIQRIQSMVRGAAAAAVSGGGSGTPSKGAQQESGSKTHKAAKRAPWNEEWNSNNPSPAAAPGPGSARDSPAGSARTPPRVVRAQSMGRAATPPQLTRTQSASPSTRGEQRYPAVAEGQSAGDCRNESEYLGAHYGSPSGMGLRPNVQLQRLDSGDPVLSQASSGRAPSSTRYGLSHGQDTVLTHSHAAVIDTLNPEEVSLQQRQAAACSALRPPSAGARPSKPPSTAMRSPIAPATQGPALGQNPTRVVVDPTLMSLSHMSLVGSPAGKGQRTGPGLTGMGIQRSQLVPGIPLRHHQQQEQGCGDTVWEPQLPGLTSDGRLLAGDKGEGQEEMAEGEEEDVYEDDFEHVEESELQQTATQGRLGAATDIRALRQSVSVLNSLVQMKIHQLAVGESTQGISLDRSPADQQEDKGSTGHNVEAQRAGSQADQDASWTAEDRALTAGLDMSHSLLDGELGQSSLLVPGQDPAEGWRVLQHSDLDYLDRLGGVGDGAHDFDAHCSQDDTLEQQLEAAAPVGDTAAWGNKRIAAAPSAAAGAASAARLRQLRQQREQQQRQQGIPSAGVKPERADASQAVLAQEAEALFTSLRRLHELMSGPKAVELSPRSQGTAPSKFPATPKPETMPRGTMTPPEEEGAEAASDSAETSPLAMDVQQGSASPNGGLQPGQLTPKNQLCADDVRWMASLMHTLSSSLQDGNLEEWLPGSTTQRSGGAT